VSSKRSIFSAL